MSIVPSRPLAGEFNPYASLYIDKVPEGDVLATLAAQTATTIAILEQLGESALSQPNAPGKWTVAQSIVHLTDTERVWAYRALRFSRNDQTELASFEQDLFAANAPFAAYSMADLAEELRTVRRSTLLLFQHLTAEAWLRGGVVSGHRTTVRALAYLMAGHEIHHQRILQP